MTKTLPARPNLDHLRRQAKALLAGLAAGDAGAFQTLSRHLPAAKGMSAQQIRDAGFRLADAQSAVARSTGFAGWPHLARYVEQLRSLEGTWVFQRLEIDGATVPPGAMAQSRILIDGDRFRTESPGVVYEGTFSIDVEATPHTIDIEFNAGPEAGRINRGIFALAGDRLEICLDMTGRARPGAFVTTAGSGCAYEVLSRASASRPAGVTGALGERAAGTATPEATDAATPKGFEPRPSDLLRRLQGDWTAERIVRDGKELPAFMLTGARRHASGNELTITVAGQVAVHALVRVDEAATPTAVDYFHLSGPAKGRLSAGIMRWQGGSAWFCMSPPDEARPEGFDCPAGSGRTLSVWKPSKA
ncbi:MAG: TIGR03067 domain-containing protein [Phycisphaerae bacterium]|nr:TIGR03067 domain-containing protein [Phycisphaerae bacterium]